MSYECQCGCDCSLCEECGFPECECKCDLDYITDNEGDKKNDEEDDYWN